MASIESIPLPALQCDASGRIVAVNQLAAKQFERGPEELVGRTFEELRALLPGAAEPAPVCEIPLAEGRLLLFSDGALVRRLQQQVYHLSRLASAGRLVSVVVHEINNSLSGILGYAQLLLAQQLPPAARRDLGRIHDETLRTARVAQRLLKFSRAGIGERCHFSLPDVVQRCVELKRRDFALHAICVDLDLPADLPPLHGDETLVAQVILNLLTNAQQSITAVREQGLVRISAHATTRRVVVDVEDDGPGIPDHLHERVFEPFFTSRPNDSGTGLGLTLCREIVVEHGGEIRVRRGRLPGACLRLLFPPATGSAARPTSSHEPLPPPPPLRDCRIVVIEDEPSMRDLLTRAFAGNGNHTVVFEHGEDALPYLATASVDLILSDIRRPGVDGIRLHDHLALTRPALLRRLLFITGDVLSPETAAFLQRSQARWLMKPLRLDALFQEARTIVERPNNQGELFAAAGT
jgi:two-component system NtrC family sensor kinase